MTSFPLPVSVGSRAEYRFLSGAFLDIWIKTIIPRMDVLMLLLLHGPAYLSTSQNCLNSSTRLLWLMIGAPFCDKGQTLSRHDPSCVPGKGDTTGTWAGNETPEEVHMVGQRLCRCRSCRGSESKAQGGGGVGYGTGNMGHRNVKSSASLCLVLNNQEICFSMAGIFSFQVVNNLNPLF